MNWGEGDTRFFDYVSRLYDVFMPSADADRLGAGLGLASRDVERLVDIGGGTGRGACAVGADERVVVDASEGMLRRADPELGRVLGSAHGLPLVDSCADAVIVVDALHHMRDACGVLREAERVLRTGGVVVVREFDPSTVRGRCLAAVERSFGFGSSFWTPDELVRKARDAGLDASVTERGFAYTVAGVKTP